MTTVNEYNLALSMMRQWGKDARCSARNYAIEGFRKGDTAEFCKWHDVGRIIEQMQANSMISGISGQFLRNGPQGGRY
jgi:hypothetical protein